LRRFGSGNNGSINSHCASFNNSNHAPSLHTSEDSRWDYRVIIVRSSADAPQGQSEGEIAKQLFPDQATFKREENRRWELTTNHWDLPIHVVSLDATN
jgi:hypothetical protein